MSRQALGIFQALDISWQVPFAPHAALTLHLSRDPRLLFETKARKPTPLPRDFAKLLGNFSEQPRSP